MQADGVARSGLDDQAEDYIRRPHDGTPDPLSVVTPYGSRDVLDARCQGASEKHALLRHLVYQLTSQYPWLQALLEASGAQVLAMQGGFFFSLPSDPGKSVEIPFLSAQLHLLPWREPEEQAH
jgi:hypothetical protein